MPKSDVQETCIVIGCDCKYHLEFTFMFPDDFNCEMFCTSKNPTRIQCMSCRLTIRLWCSVQLYYFPLDDQECNLNLMSCKYCKVM